MTRRLRIEFSGAINVTLNATAADSDGTISKVEFYNGTTLLGTDTSNPYSLALTNVAAGTYSYTAKRGGSLAPERRQGPP
jgi:hypothetical protein